MTTHDIAQALRIAAAELEEGREATARHFAQRAWYALVARQGPPPRARVERLRVVRVETKRGEG